MEIVKHNEAFDELTVSSKPFIQNLIHGDKISTMPAAEAGRKILQIVKLAEFDSGLNKIHPDDLIILSKSIYDLVMDVYPSLTIQELKTACKSGVLGNYGEWYGINLKTVSFWIKGYMSSEGRAKAIKEWNAKMDVKTASKPTVNWETTKSAALNAFESYKNTGRLPFGAFAYYDIINEAIGQDYNGIKTLVTDKEERKRICDEVLKIHENVATKEKQISDKNGNYANSEKLMEAIMTGFKGSMEKERKTAFLKSFFDKLIQENKPLNL